MSIRVFIIDDHAIVRTGMRMILSAQTDIEVVGEADSGEHALPQLRALAPDVVLCDLHLPGLSGLEVTDRIVSGDYGTRVIIVLDEYDRAESDQFRQSVAELIKNLSDRAARVQLVLAGVASNLQQLIGYIPSIRRNIIGLPMPRLSSEEVRALIRIGEKSAGVEFDEEAVKAIEQLSNGSAITPR